jgi:hypothetical protein
LPVASNLILSLTTSICSFAPVSIRPQQIRTLSLDLPAFRDGDTTVIETITLGLWVPTRPQKVYEASASPHPV